MSDLFAVWTSRIVFTGLFVILLAHFGKFVYNEVWPIIEPLVRRINTWWQWRL